jgi:hypothetical protein
MNQRNKFYNYVFFFASVAIYSVARTGGFHDAQEQGVYEASKGSVRSHVLVDILTHIANERRSSGEILIRWSFTLDNIIPLDRTRKEDCSITDESFKNSAKYALSLQQFLEQQDKKLRKIEKRLQQ